MNPTRTYLTEEQPDGTVREFWVDTAHPVRHTLELQDDNGTISVCVWSEVTDSSAEWETRTVLRLSHGDAQKMIERLTRLTQQPPGRCDFCGIHPPRWVFDFPAGFLPDLTASSGVRITQVDDGRWNACERCAAWVERKDAATLADIVIGAMQAAGIPTAQSPHGRAELAAVLVNQYEALFTYPFTKNTR